MSAFLLFLFKRVLALVFMPFGGLFKTRCWEAAALPAEDCLISCSHSDCQREKQQFDERKKEKKTPSFFRFWREPPQKSASCEIPFTDVFWHCVATVANKLAIEKKIQYLCWIRKPFEMNTTHTNKIWIYCIHGNFSLRVEPISCSNQQRH